MASRREYLRRKFPWRASPPRPLRRLRPAAPHRRLTINGNFGISGATFDELIGASGNGLLDVNGTATLGAGSLLSIDLLRGFTPFVGESFTLMDFLGGTGVFANAPATGFQMELQLDHRLQRE